MSNPDSELYKSTKHSTPTNHISPPESTDTNPTTTPPPFPLLSLPLELQRLIFHHSFSGPYDITLENERLTMLRTRFHVHGIPPLNLLLTSRHIYEHAAPIRHNLFTGRLVLNSVFILVALRRQERFQWLRDNVRILHFSDSSVHPERWGAYFGGLVRLGRLEIVFPSVVRLDAVEGGREGEGECRRWGLSDVMSGGKEVDEWLVRSLDEFRLTLVNQLRARRLEVVVTQRYELGGGEGEQEVVEIDIRLTEDGTEVVRREALMEEKRADVECQKPAKPIRANGNMIDAGSHRSIWEWYQAGLST